MTTTTKKMTKRDYFNILKKSYPVTAENYNDVIAFIDHEIELLERKNSAEKKPTAAQKANTELKEVIVKSMTRDRNYTITEMIKEFPALSELTNQKVSAMVRQLVEANLIEKIEDKRKSYFKLVQG